MKKKNQRSSVAADEPRAVYSASSDIKSMIHDHSLFFDTLVELIPAKFYLPTDEQEKVWFQGLTKAGKAKAKKKTIENTKKARRERLDPEKSSKTTLDLLKESVVEKSEIGALDGDSEGEETKKAGGADGDGRAVTYEELRQRLRRKIEDLRSGRGGTEQDEERRMEKEEERKRKREEWSKKKRGDNEEKEKKREVENKVSMAAQGIEFGKVKLGDDDLERGKNKKRKLSKEEELERARKLQEANKDPEKGKVVAEKHSWQAAASRAMGVKVHDNPRLLKESLQRDKRKHKKSVEKWKDRVKNTESMKKDKQDKRKGNIDANIEKKKMKKIERREKKLMKKRPASAGGKE